MSSMLKECEVNNHKRCTRCDNGTMKRWSELNEEEQEVVKRLPGAVDYTDEHRRSMHRWCPRCWHEEVEKPRPA